MAHKKAGGSTSYGRDSHGQRLGVKLAHGAFAKPGAIIVRQRGSKVFPGPNVMRAGDDSLFATVGGFVKFTTRVRLNFAGKRREVKIVSVLPQKA